jgi:bifunctional non-homologous end joining protein LigD
MPRGLGMKTADPATMAARPQPLALYWAKRDFATTPEPKGRRAKRGESLSFVIQKHAATRLHYDFRLELDGVLLSWAVPKGPSFDPKEKRMAVHVEDHPVPYGSFEGTIPPRQYGAGSVIVWDRGTWEPVGDPREGLRNGKLVFRLHGEKLAGLWELVRIRKPDDRQDPWMLFKKRDAWARPLAEYDVIRALPDSVVAKPLGPVEEREPREAAPVAADGAHAQPDLSAALPSALPETLAPQLATLVDRLPTSGTWSYEIKFDGYRLLARIEGGKARLVTRNGNDWTSKLPQVASAVEKLGIDSAWLDGEIVVLDDNGAPDFNALQNAIETNGKADISYFVFDAPYFEGYDLRKLPLASRRALLRRLFEMKSSDGLRFSEDFHADVDSLLASACRLHIEGIVAKRTDAPYVSARSETWLKLKCLERQEFVVGGYTDRTGSTSEIGGLLLGVHDDAGKLRYAGKVGTGWSADTARQLKKKLARLEIDKSPFDGPIEPGRWSKRPAGGEHWVKPQLVAEVSFAQWTPDGHVRHASFEGLRVDKPARQIKRERAVSAVAAGGANGKVANVKVSNPERVIDASKGLKKLDLVRYYESVADWMLPHLQGRPVSLVRGPSGIGGELFFQKHPETKMPGMTELDPALWPNHAALMEVGSAEALVAAAQMNVIEFHTWNAKSKNIGKPDRMIFDLDPGEGTSWKMVQEAAMLTRAMLTELGLVSFLKTSGGKGLHVVVPLTPRHDWDTVKGFSQAIVEHLARAIPDRFVAKSGASNRVGKLFVDYLRNGHGATTAAAFSARARPGLGVSMPVGWEQLPSLKSGAQWNITTAREYLSFQQDDPWADYWNVKQTLTSAMKVLRYKPPANAATAVAAR